MYIRITSTKSRSFCMTAFSASLTIPVVFLRQSRDCSYNVCRTLAPSLTYAHTTSRTLPTYDISLISLTLPAYEAGDFVELILLYIYIFTIVSTLKFSGYNFMCKFHISALSYVRYCLQPPILIRPQSLFFHYIKRFTFKSVRNKRERTYS